MKLGAGLRLEVDMSVRRYVSPVSDGYAVGIGRGEWIRTTDLLVPNQAL